MVSLCLCCVCQCKGCVCAYMHTHHCYTAWLCYGHTPSFCCPCQHLRLDLATTLVLDIDGHAWHIQMGQALAWRVLLLLWLLLEVVLCGAVDVVVVVVAVAAALC